MNIGDELEREIRREAWPLAAELIERIDTFIESRAEKYNNDTDEIIDSVFFARKAATRALAILICRWEGYRVRADECEQSINDLIDEVVSQPLTRPCDILEEYKPMRWKP
ncbi:MAG TPA: hypothetical protein VGQ63_13820 [Pseudolabrys sp.]|jgi:hypothetical protein|nr:hypothetical protein [Pseudolabrys sp.]